jgi:RNA polymerase sigma-70 factor, ECF subfamily
MEPRNESDEGLMRQVALGKPEALNALLRRYASPLLTFLQRTVGHRQRAEDLFQEVFLAVWAWRRRYSYPRPFRPWLFGIALNKCRADLRRRTYTPTLLDDCPLACPVASDPAPTEAAVAAETATLVAEAVGRLPPRAARGRVQSVARLLSQQVYRATLGPGHDFRQSVEEGGRI